MLAGSALLIGAAIGYAVPLSQRVVSSVMAVGAGVLISALSFELMEEAAAQGGLRATALGFVAGALVISSAAGMKKAGRWLSVQARCSRGRACVRSPSGLGLHLGRQAGRSAGWRCGSRTALGGLALSEAGRLSGWRCGSRPRSPAVPPDRCRRLAARVD